MPRAGSGPGGRPQRRCETAGHRSGQKSIGQVRQPGPQSPVPISLGQHAHGHRDGRRLHEEKQRGPRPDRRRRPGSRAPVQHDRGHRQGQRREESRTHWHDAERTDQEDCADDHGRAEHHDTSDVVESRQRQRVRLTVLPTPDVQERIDQQHARRQCRETGDAHDDGSREWGTRADFVDRSDRRLTTITARRAAAVTMTARDPSAATRTARGPASQPASSGTNQSRPRTPSRTPRTGRASTPAATSNPSAAPVSISLPAGTPPPKVVAGLSRITTTSTAVRASPSGQRACRSQVIGPEPGASERVPAPGGLCTVKVPSTALIRSASPGGHRQGGPRHHRHRRR